MTVLTGNKQQAMFVKVLKNTSEMTYFSLLFQFFRWYHDLTRNSAEALLLDYGRQGSYLIRPSKNNPGHYAVSVRWVNE